MTFQGTINIQPPPPFSLGIFSVSRSVQTRGAHDVVVWYCTWLAGGWVWFVCLGTCYWSPIHTHSHTERKREPRPDRLALQNRQQGKKTLLARLRNQQLSQKWSRRDVNLEMLPFILRRRLTIGKKLLLKVGEVWQLETFNPRICWLHVETARSDASVSSLCVPLTSVLENFPQTIKSWADILHRRTGGVSCYWWRTGRLRQQPFSHFAVQSI